MHNKKRFFPGNAFLSAFSVFAFFLILIKGQVAIRYVSLALSLCARTVIPSLFPFMIISSLLTSSGGAERIGQALAPPMKKLFGISGGGACAFLLGTLCGFPLGAKTIAALYDRGAISKGEANRLMTFCNNAGSAYVISAVGISLFSDRSFGLLLYICVILSAVIIGICGRFFQKDTKSDICDPISSQTKKLDSSLFTDAVQDSAKSMLTVCAFVVFFYATVGCIGSLLEPLSLPAFLHALIFGFFEMTSGVGEAAAVSDSLLSPLLCAFFLGWSGLSVHFQVMSACSGRGISYRGYFIAKFIQGLLCAGLVYIAMKFIFPSLPRDAEDIFLTFPSLPVQIFKLFMLCLFASALIIFALSRFFSSKSKTKQKKG